MKILHISGAKGWGGNEQQMVSIVPELQKMGVENLVYGVNHSVLQQSMAELNIPFIPAQAPKLNKWANYRDLKRVVEREKPDLIHLHTSDSLTVFTLADKLYKLGVRAVFSKKGMGSSSSFLSKLKYNYANVQSIFCVSQSVARDFSPILTEKNRSKLRVIHDCVSLAIAEVPAPFNLRDRYALADTQSIVGNIANHTAAKDIPTLLRAVAHWVHDLNRPDVTLVQMGEFSKLTPTYRALAEELNIVPNVIFTDKLPHAYAFNPQFAAFVMSSQREGGPTSVLEAMLLGSAVVSTAVGVVPDVIRENETGKMVAVKDAQALAQACIELVNQPEKAREIGQNAAAMVRQNFLAQQIAAEHLAAYQALLAYKN